MGVGEFLLKALARSHLFWLIVTGPSRGLMRSTAENRPWRCAIPKHFQECTLFITRRRWAADQRKFTHALTTVDGGFLGGSGEDALQIVGDFPAAEIGVEADGAWPPRAGRVESDPLPETRGHLDCSIDEIVAARAVADRADQRPSAGPERGLEPGQPVRPDGGRGRHDPRAHRGARHRPLRDVDPGLDPAGVFQPLRPGPRPGVDQAGGRAAGARAGARHPRPGLDHAGAHDGPGPGGGDDRSA